MNSNIPRGVIDDQCQDASDWLEWTETTSEERIITQSHIVRISNISWKLIRLTAACKYPPISNTGIIAIQIPPNAPATNVREYSSVVTGPSHDGLKRKFPGLYQSSVRGSSEICDTPCLMPILWSWKR